MAFSTLNIGLIETEIADRDVARNLSNIDVRISQLPEQCDLAILPELVTTGFVSDVDVAHSQAQRNTGDSMRSICQMANKNSCAICGSFLASTAGRVFNRAFFIEPNGDDTFYDKKHLFTMGGESEVFASSDRQSPIIRFRGWNIKPIICYDLRFPVFCRNVDNGYDLMVVVANWPKARYNAWKSLLVARAIENCCYVCGVNRCGVNSEGLDFGNGSSIVVDYKGNIVAETSIDNPTAIASLSIEKLNSFRKGFPVWKDADRFTLE